MTPSLFLEQRPHPLPGTGFGLWRFEKGMGCSLAPFPFSIPLPGEHDKNLRSDFESLGQIGEKFFLRLPQILPLASFSPLPNPPGGVFTARVVLHLPLPQTRTPSRRAFVLLGVLLQREGIVGQPFSTTASYFFKASFHLA